MSGSGAQGLCGHNIPVSMASAAYINLIKRICCEYVRYTYVCSHVHKTYNICNTYCSCVCRMLVHLRSCQFE